MLSRSGTEDDVPLMDEGGDARAGVSNGNESLGDGAGEARTARRYAQIRYAEARLRPLQGTRYASTYWLVFDELRRLRHELGRETFADDPGS
jgi:hypothetical protein